MHKAHALGLSRIEIWAQPSQRLPAAKRAQVWTEIRQALQPPTTAIISPHSSSSHATDVLQGPDCPSEFIDTITQNIMQDPVVLPSSIRCDRSTIARHLSMRSTDPFTGLPLEYDQAKPDLALQLRIREWISSQKGRHAASINKDEPKQY
ncbi:Ubiquitin conjugation factor E4 A [Coemansia thaxteri]|uniref:Ubiquitin conjugation factor E4 A n=1 Tax=Coemansia thaxteri TaxID=2663907 RepID=A0A9W8B859_9FUNG|nr:Ubiquitin conjugation factor E4 A [Coemansia thaxteri]KAJ2472539.1 Ubiquitin conjugation factor E4 A [Coemansia sp. RSA 2320]